MQDAASPEFSYLIEGGAPAGNNMPPGLEGCRTTRTNINTITMQGNKSTAPRGIDILEFPRRRILLRKNASLGEIRSLCRERSPSDGSFSRDGRFGEEGIRLAMFCTIPISATG